MRNLYAEEGRRERMLKGDLPRPPKRQRPNLSWIKRRFSDVAYDPATPMGRMDIFLPDTGDGPFPTIFFIHGGAFRVGDRLDGQVAPFLEAVRRGYAVATVDYRLSGEVIFPRSLMDCKAALRFLKAQSHRFQIDSERIAVVGDSSGANLALMIAATPGVSELEDLSMGNPEQNTSVKCGVVWFPPTDFAQMDEMFLRRGLESCATHSLPHSPESDYMGATLTEIEPRQLLRASPLAYITAEFPPVLVQHGTADRVVPFEQSVLLAERVNALCGQGRVTLDLLEGADHEDPMFKTPENMNRVFQYLDCYLK